MEAQRAGSGYHPDILNQIIYHVQYTPWPSLVTARAVSGSHVGWTDEKWLTT